MEIPGTERDLRNFTLHTMISTMPRPRVLHRFMGAGLCSGISRLNEKMGLVAALRGLWELLLVRTC